MTIENAIERVMSEYGIKHNVTGYRKLASTMFRWYNGSTFNPRHMTWEDLFGDHNLKRSYDNVCQALDTAITNNPKKWEQCEYQRISGQYEFENIMIFLSNRIMEVFTLGD